MSLIIRENVVIEAIKDYKYLLNRGYPRTLALNTVTTRYMLNKRERLLLYRIVHTDEQVQKIISKLINVESIDEFPLIIDGYNVILTIKAALMCDYVYESDDTFVRDLLSVHGAVKYDTYFNESLNLLIRTIKELNVPYVLIVLDKQVSKSGELARSIRSLLEKYGVNGNAETMRKNDVFIISKAKDYVVCSSDVVILLKAEKAFDLAGYIIKKYMPNKVIRLKIP